MLSTCFCQNTPDKACLFRQLKPTCLFGLFSLLGKKHVGNFWKIWAYVVKMSTCDNMFKRVVHDDRIVGFEDLNEFGTKSCSVAKHALQFMVRGISTRWKQPFAFWAFFHR